MRHISQKGLNLIKRYEGVRLKAYKPVATEPGWTIGYGHHDEHVHKGQVITQAQIEQSGATSAEQFLKTVSVAVQGNSNVVAASTAGANVGWLWSVQLVNEIAAEAVGAAGLLETVSTGLSEPIAA